MTSITLLIKSANQGDRDSAKKVWDSLYNEIHQIAQKQISRETPGHTLQTTDLFQEAYLDIEKSPLPNCNDQSHFLALVAKRMQRFLINYSRKKNALKRSGAHNKVRLTLVASQLAVFDNLTTDSGIAILNAIDDLEQIDEISGHVARLRFVHGLKVAQVANDLCVSERTVKNKTKYAKAWISDRLGLNYEYKS